MIYIKDKQTGNIGSIYDLLQCEPKDIEILDNTQEVIDKIEERMKENQEDVVCDLYGYDNPCEKANEDLQWVLSLLQQ